MAKTSVQVTARSCRVQNVFVPSTSSLDGSVSSGRKSCTACPTLPGPENFASIAPCPPMIIVIYLSGDNFRVSLSGCLLLLSKLCTPCLYCYLFWESTAPILAKYRMPKKLCITCIKNLMLYTIMNRWM